MNSAHSRVAGKTAAVTGGRGDLGSAPARCLPNTAQRSQVLTWQAFLPPSPREASPSTTSMSPMRKASRTRSAASPRTSAPWTSWSIGPESSAPPERPHIASITDFDTLFNVNVRASGCNHVRYPRMIEKAPAASSTSPRSTASPCGPNVPLYHATKAPSGH